MKLLFLFDMPIAHEMYWRDGLWAALQVLSKDWEVTYHNLAIAPITPEKLVQAYKKYDFILGWGGGDTMGDKLGFLGEAYTDKRVGLCFGGGDIMSPRIDSLGVVFVENEFQVGLRPNHRLAFGTNTNLFFPRKASEMFDALYPAAFADWKHQEKFAEICKQENLKGLAVGYIQKNNLEESLRLVNDCVSRGVGVLDWIPAESLALLYNQSKEVIITADASGGCERAILEAKASGIPVRVESGSQKLHDWNTKSEEEIREKWNHKAYAEMLKKGINEVLS